MNKKIIAASIVIIIIIATAIIFGFLFLKQQKGCTMEAKICPDGSSVGRSGLNCQFAACPGENNNDVDIKIDPDYQKCAQDSDCMLVSNKCSCDCGVPINHQYFDKVTNPDNCKNYNRQNCKLMCAAPICKDNRCSSALERNVISNNDSDEHGCIDSAGYQWCEEKQKCLRSWEESCSTTESNKVEFDACGKKDKYQKSSWWNKYVSKVTNTNDEVLGNLTSADIDNMEGCLSKDGKIFISVLPGEYMGIGNHLFKYLTNSNSLLEAMRAAKKGNEFVWKSPPTVFMERKGNIIKMHGMSGDAGVEEQIWYDYDFMKNEVVPTKSCVTEYDPMGGDPKTKCDEIK